MWPTNYVSNDLFQVANPKFATRLFVEHANALGVEITQNKTLATFTAAFNAVVVGNTTVNFIPKAQQQFPDGEHFLVTSIRMFQGANATLAQTAWTAGITDALFQNGDLTLTNNGTQELLTLPFTRFQPGTNWPESGWLYLSKPIMWVAQTNLAVTGNFTTASATANLNGRLELTGLKLI